VKGLLSSIQSAAAKQLRPRAARCHELPVIQRVAGVCSTRLLALRASVQAVLDEFEKSRVFVTIHSHHLE
jgi:hypothetical protein